jgi:hypothetical protein
MTGGKKPNPGEIPLQWVENLTGDFSFKDNWSYPEGVYRNEFGQLSCDGLCPPETDEMKDEYGKIHEDSLESFYQFIDTTHLYHSLKSEAQTDEWAGTDYMMAERISRDTIVCFTQNNAATHSSLNLMISRNTVLPTIVVTGISRDSGTKIYNCTGGEMVIDKKSWNEGILKATFDFEFHHSEKMYWRGNIYAVIETK